MEIKWQKSNLKVKRRSKKKFKSKKNRKIIFKKGNRMSFIIFM